MAKQGGSGDGKVSKGLARYNRDVKAGRKTAHSGGGKAKSGGKKGYDPTAYAF